MQSPFPISQEDAAARVLRQWRRFKLRSQFLRIVDQSNFLRKHETRVKQLDRKVQAVRRLSLPDDSMLALELSAALLIQRCFRRAQAWRMQTTVREAQRAVQAATRIQRLWRIRRLRRLTATMTLGDPLENFNPHSAISQFVNGYINKPPDSYDHDGLLQKYLSFRPSFSAQSAASFTQSLLRRSAALRAAVAAPELLPVAVVTTSETRKKEATEYREFRLCGNSLVKVENDAIEQLNRLNALLSL